MKKNLLIVIVMVLTIICVGMGIKIYFVNKELQNNKTIYCVMEDSESKLEIYYDFKDGQAYKFTMIATNAYSDDIKIDSYISSMNNANLKYRGATEKIWYNDNEFVTTEIYDLNLLTEDEFKEITGMSKTKIQKMSRSEIIDSIIPIVNSNSNYRCE